MTQAYKLSLLYFLLFSLLLLVSGALLFEHKIGFNLASISSYYLGNEESFAPAKTLSGVLKIILPHIFAFGLFLMVLLHFLVFTKNRGTKATRTLIYLLFSSAFLEIFSPIFILLGFEVFAVMKILSFLLLQLLTLYTIYLVFHSIVYD